MVVMAVVIEPGLPAYKPCLLTTTLLWLIRASTNKKTYSDYLQAAREAEKEEVMEPSHSQTADNTNKPKVMSFFPLQKVKGTQPTKTPAVRVVHLEEGSNREGDIESEDPDGNEGMTEEFIVHLAGAVKDAQKEEKYCYHWSSPDHFIHECLLVKASRTANHWNQKEGMALEKGAQALQAKVAKMKVPQEGMPKA